MSYLFSLASPPATDTCGSKVVPTLSISWVCWSLLKPPWWDLIFPTSVSSYLLSVFLHWMQAPWGSGLVPFTTVISSIPTRVYLCAGAAQHMCADWMGRGRKASSVRAGVCLSAPCHWWGRKHGTMCIVSAQQIFADNWIFAPVGPTACPPTLFPFFCEFCSFFKAQFKAYLCYETGPAFPIGRHLFLPSVWCLDH